MLNYAKYLIGGDVGSKMKIWLFCLGIVGLFCPDSVSPCTGVKLVAKDDSIIYGRTLEFGVPLETSVVVVPRGIQISGTTPLGQGLVYTTKYASLGIVISDDLSILDGLNEKGLSIGTFFFPLYADYAEITQENRSIALSPTEFSNWILTQFATVEELVLALDKVLIAPTRSEDWGGVAPPFHYIVSDQSGKCLVIEPLKGKLVTYDNPLGILTNSPSFDWHLTNLRNYINLRATNVAPLKIDNLVFAPFGQGSGMVGLPGDFTPPSRFVRSFVFCQTALPADTAEQTVFQTFHILNQFDIPLGVARSVDKDGIHADFTQATCVRDPKSLKYYFKTYQDQTVRCIDLSRFDVHAKTVKKVSTSGFEKSVDISKELK